MIDCILSTVLGIFRTFYWKSEVDSIFFAVQVHVRFTWRVYLSTGI
jgi:hypothetical protein